MEKIQVYASGVGVEKTEEWFAALAEVLEEAASSCYITSAM